MNARHRVAHAAASAAPAPEVWLRMRRIALALLAALMSGGFPAAPVAAAEGNRVAVIPLGTRLGQSQVGSDRAYGGGPSTQKQNVAATNELLVALSKIGYVKVVDQGLITERMAMLDSLPAARDAHSSKRAGELLAADWIVTGDLIYTSEKGYREETDFTDSGRERTIRIPTLKVSVKLSADMINAGTGEKFSHVAEGVKVMSGRGETGSGNVENAVVEALPMAATRLAGDLAAHISLSGTVLAVEETEVKKKKKTLLVIGLGEPSGVEAGMEFDVLRPGGTVTDPATGTQKALPERNVGRCRVTEVGSETSYAELKSGMAVAGDKAALRRSSSPSTLGDLFRR